jgi:hypothetical protein
VGGGMAAACNGKAGRRLTILVLSFGLGGATPGTLLMAADSAAAGAPEHQPAGATDRAQAAEAIERLRGVVAGVTIPEQLKGEMARVNEALSQAQADLDAGRAHLAWWRLSSAVAELTALRAYAGNKDEPAAFESEQARAGDLEGAARKALADPALARAPALRRALAEAALNVVQRYQSSGSAFAKASQPGSGIYYLNMGRGHLEFATLAVAAEPAAAGGPPAGVAHHPVPPPLGDRLRALEQATAEAYAKPGAGVAQHPQFIALSATLKESRELSDAGLRHGALYKHLDALRRLRAVAEAAVPPREDLERRLETARARLAAAPGDHGIGWLFWEMAAFNLGGGGPDEKERLQRAAAVLDAALPEYFEIVGGRAAPALPATAKKAEEVRLTLVRWPYT